MDCSCFACVCVCVRTCVRQKLPKVNKELALKLMEEGDEDADLASRKKKGKVRKSTRTDFFQPLFFSFFAIFIGTI